MPRLTPECFTSLPDDVQAEILEKVPVDKLNEVLMVSLPENPLEASEEQAQEWIHYTLESLPKQMVYHLVKFLLGALSDPDNRPPDDVFEKFGKYAVQATIMFQTLTIIAGQLSKKENTDDQED